MSAAPLIRPVEARDAEAITRIYNHYIKNTVVTFEEQEIPVAELHKRIGAVTGASFPWVVAELEGRVVGYAYADTWRSRCAYRFTLESTVYLEPGFSGRGLGKALYKPVMEACRAQNIHALIGVIALPNPASVALHEKLGFVKAAHFKEVGFKFGQWVDVGYWQLNL